MANGNLPEELLIEILCRLPVKTLLRSKSVCKNWYSLIQNPSFISLHCKHSAGNTDCLLVKRSLNGSVGLSFVPNETTVEDIDISSTGLESLDIRDLELLGPCNGVVCLTKGSFNSTVVMCNPSIREFRLLPRPSHKKDYVSNLGFGFDPSTNDYKVVRFGFWDPDSGTAPHDETVEIYDLSTDSWREVDVNPNIGVDLDFPFLSCTSWKGGCYWYISCSDAIIVFRLMDEVFDEIPVPEVCSLANSRELFILDDSLALVHYPSDDWLHPLGLTRGYFPLMKCFDVWVMDEDGVEVSWTKKLTIGPLQGIEFALGFRQNGEFLCETGRGQMMSHHIDTQHIKEYQVYGFPLTHSLQVIVYTESLVSVKRNIKRDGHNGLNM